LEKWQRATKNELDSILFRSGKIKRHPDLFTEIYDVDGNIVEPAKITRQNELSGAGIEYLISICEYFFTHHKKAIQTNHAHYFTLPPADWNAILDIATGGISGQRERAERAILQWHAKPKPVLITAADGHLYSMIPFVLVFDWGRPEELNAAMAARLARLNKDKGKKAYTDERLPIKSVTIMGAKPLFEDYFRKGAGTYSFPVGMYAKMFDVANKEKKGIAKQKNTLLADVKKIAPDANESEIKQNIKNLEELDTETHISAYVRFARYLMRHHNFTPDQLKDKKKVHTTSLSFFLVSFLAEVYPSALSKNGRGEIHVDPKIFNKFWDNAMWIYHKIAGFKIYPVFKEYRDGKVFLDLYTDAKEAEKEQFKISKK
jgi:hypothetical protein